MTEAETAGRFYEDNYDLVASHVITPGVQKQILPSSTPGACRFCGRSKSEATFRNEAHAIPESTGNRTLLICFECDECNQRFGTGIENDFGCWTRPMRVLARIPGKNGFPAVRLDHAGGWRIQGGSAGVLNITGDDNPAFVEDEQNKLVHIKQPRDPYTPIGVVKALVKMALTIVPEEELGAFRDAMRWIGDPDHAAGRHLAHPVLETLVPGDVPSRLFAVAVWRRKHDRLNVPYATFTLTYANVILQTFLPSPTLNANIAGKTTRVYRFPHITELIPTATGPSLTTHHDMSGAEVFKGGVVEAALSFDKRIDRKGQSGS